MFLRPAVIFSVLWALSGICFASNGAIPSIAELTALDSPDLGIVIGDLDGDGHTEIAIVRSEGLGPNGVRYRIDLNLTTHALPSSFTISSDRTGLRIITRDLDGDGDLDLVITSSLSPAPVSVWINDGRGGGAAGDPAGYPRAIWTEESRAWVGSDTSHEVVPATILRSSRTWLDALLTSDFHTQFLVDHIVILPISGGPQEPAVTGLSNRGPPNPSQTWLDFSSSIHHRAEYILGHIRPLPRTDSPLGPAVSGLSNRSPPPCLPQQSI